MAFPSLASCGVLLQPASRGSRLNTETAVGGTGGAIGSGIGARSRTPKDVTWASGRTTSFWCSEAERAVPCERVRAAMRTTMLRVLATLIACCAFAQERSTARDILLPEGISRARCIAADGRAYSSTANGQTLRIDCAGAPETVVRCDFDGGEPLDVTLDAFCRADTSPVVLARSVQVRARRPTELTAEWVRFGGRPDEAVSVVARRALTVQGSVDLPVAQRDDRFITFIRPGLSPVTMHSGLLDANGGWTVPDAAPGGELVVRAARAPIEAAKYHLAGGVRLETQAVRNVASFRAVPPGVYELVPEYEGGLRGQRTAVRIQPGQATFVALQEEQVGGVQVMVDPTLCSDSTTFAISEIRSSPKKSTATSSVETVLTLPTRQECAHIIAGLWPGEYQVSLRGKKGQLAAQTFQVTSQALTSVSLSHEAVYVSGRVNLNGSPLPNVVIRFIPEGRAAAEDQARTDEGGGYDLTLPAPGRFQVWFERDGRAMLGNEREVTFSAGPSERDFDLHGATLKVTLNQWARRAPIDMSVRPVWMTSPGKSGDILRVLPADPLPVVFSGLSYGKYAVQARENPAPGQKGHRTAGAIVTVEDGQAETEIELTLTDSAGIVRVFDQTGAPVADATVKAGDDRLMRAAPGVFSLANVVPATSLLVSAPGFAPVLRLVKESPFDIVLTRGKPVRLQFAGGNPPLIKGILVWPGTDAPVPLHLFAVTRAQDASGDYIVHNFPEVPGVLYIPGPFDPPERYQSVAPDANNIIRIK